MIAMTTSSSINVKALFFFMKTNPGKSHPTRLTGKRTIDDQKFKTYFVVCQNNSRGRRNTDGHFTP